MQMYLEEARRDVFSRRHANSLFFLFFFFFIFLRLGFYMFPSTKCSGISLRLGNSCRVYVLGFVPKLSKSDHL